MVHERDWKTPSATSGVLGELASSYEYGRKWFGEYLVLTGRTNEAVAQLQAAVRQHPDSPAARAGLCRILYFAGRLPEAIEKCQIALDDFPEFRMAHRTLYQIAFDMGDVDRTLFHWLETSGMSPADASNPAVAAYRRGGLTGLWHWVDEHTPQHARCVRADLAMRLGNTV